MLSRIPRGGCRSSTPKGQSTQNIHSRFQIPRITTNACNRESENGFSCHNCHGNRSAKFDCYEKLFPDYTFVHKIPHRNNWGGVGIYVYNSLANVGPLDEINIVLECDCTKCEVESLIHVQWCNVHHWRYL